jgi:hypothetical protein
LVWEWPASCTSKRRGPRIVVKEIVDRVIAAQLARRFAERLIAVIAATTIGAEPTDARASQLGS